MFSNLTRTLDQLGIRPIGAAPEAATPLTEFRRVAAALGGEPKPLASAPPEQASSGVLAESEPTLRTGTPVPASETPVLVTPAPAAPTSSKAGGRAVRLGDSVRVRFADGRAQTITVRIVPEHEADGRTRIAWKSPLATAVLGLRTEDEAEVEIDGKTRTVIVEEIIAERALV